MFKSFFANSRVGTLLDYYKFIIKLTDTHQKLSVKYIYSLLLPIVPYLGRLKGSTELGHLILTILQCLIKVDMDYCYEMSEESAVNDKIFNNLVELVYY